jgi:L-seryl-tRNA(Ser) seleniumtransferase
MMSEPQRPRPPSVEHVLGAVRARLDAADETAPETFTTIAREVVDAERGRLVDGAPARTVEELARAVAETIDRFLDPLAASPVRVVNATGVILHTNLGRAPWPAVAIEAAREAAQSYGYLELDPLSGRRAQRFRVAEDHLVALTGGEDALIVTNNAAAVALAVGLAGRRGVAVSRGELVEIGGGVRIPEIVRRAGARLVEVGTTNRTRAGDFEAPLAEGRASVVLRVHPSNFAQTGFVEAPDPIELARLARAHGAIVIDDLGSGALLDTARHGLAHEPMPSERLADGADIVVFSGDKLVGGPQAGLIVGRADLVARLRNDPLARAMRPDKAILAGVAATLGLYRAGVAAREIPVWRSISATPESLQARAARIVERCADDGRQIDVRVVATESTVGGGSLPGQTMPSWGVAVATASPTRAAAAFRQGASPILGRIAGDALLFDLRTVSPDEDGIIARRITTVPGIG